MQTKATESGYCCYHPSVRIDSVIGVISLQHCRSEKKVYLKQQTAIDTQEW